MKSITVRVGKDMIMTYNEFKKHQEDFSSGKITFLEHMKYMNIYFSDDEFRKQGEFLVGKIIATGQETVQGAVKGFRFDLFNWC